MPSASTAASSSAAPRRPNRGPQVGPRPPPAAARAGRGLFATVLVAQLLSSLVACAAAEAGTPPAVPSHEEDGGRANSSALAEKADSLHRRPEEGHSAGGLQGSNGTNGSSAEEEEARLPEGHGRGDSNHTNGTTEEEEGHGRGESHHTNGSSEEDEEAHLPESHGKHTNGSVSREEVALLHCFEETTILKKELDRLKSLLKVAPMCPQTCPGMCTALVNLLRHEAEFKEAMCSVQRELTCAYDTEECRPLLDVPNLLPQSRHFMWEHCRPRLWLIALIVGACFCFFVVCASCCCCYRDEAREVVRLKSWASSASSVWRRGGRKGTGTSGREEETSESGLRGAHVVV